MSGSATSPWAMSKHPSNSSFEIARSLGCLSRRPYSVLSCLRSKSSSEILKAYETQYMVNINLVSFILGIVNLNISKLTL